MLLTEIEQAVTDRYTESITTAKLDRIIAGAVRYYSRFNPLEEEITLTTVADQKEYDLIALGATNCIGVREVIGSQLLTTVTEPSMLEEYYRLLKEPYRIDMPSNDVIDDINNSAHISKFAWKWNYEKAESKLMIYPEPSTTGSSFVVRYWASHALNDDEYETIPDEDLELLAGVVIADLLDQQGMAAAMSPDYQEGLEKVTFNKMVENNMTFASELRGRLMRKYSGTAVASFP